MPAEDSPAFGAIAERFRRAGDLERAVALCQEGLAKFPGHLSARVTLGWSFLDLGRYDEARAELEQVLKRAPDNLAAIRGLAELHDRAEHDEMAAMHRDGSKWMTEAAAAGVATPELPTIAAPTIEARHVAAPVVVVEAPIPQPRPAPATQASAPKTAVAAPVVDDELEAGIAALGVFAAPKPDANTPVAATSQVPASFAVSTTPEPVVAKAAPVASTFAAPTKPETAAAPDDSSPWQPVEIESAAAHLLEATASSAWRSVEPVKSATPSIPAAWQPEPQVVEESASFETPAADLGATDFGTTDLGTTVLDADTADFPEFAEFANLGDVAGAAAPARPEETVAARAVEAAPAVPRAAEVVPVIDLSAMAPVAADTPTLIQPRVPSLEELDPELPALVDDAWSEQQDVYVLPAAVEAERAIADEGPGVWPPVIPDDPVEAPIAAREAAPEPVAPVESPAARRPSLNALNKFLRRVETRRSAVVAEYLAG